MVRLCQPLNEEVNVMNNKNNLSERKKRKCVLNLLMRLSTAPDFIIGTPNLVRGLKVGVVHHE